MGILISSLLFKICKINNNIYYFNKNRSIEWALNELEKEDHIGCFQYYWESNTPKKSTNAIRSTILSFRREKGRQFELGCNLQYSCDEFMKQEKKQKNFKKRYLKKLSYSLGKNLEFIGRMTKHSMYS